MTTEQLTDMGRQVAHMQTSAVAVWTTAMLTMSADSPEYRLLCTMGEQVQNVYHMLRLKAKEQGWTHAQINQVFGLYTTTTFI